MSDYEVKDGHIVLNAMLFSQLTLFSMDDLATTSVYRHSLKQKGNAFIKELETFSKQILLDVWSVNHEDMYQIMDYQKEMVEKIVKLRPEDSAAISAFIDRFIENPDHVLDLLQIRIVDKVQS